MYELKRCSCLGKDLAEMDLHLFGGTPGHPTDELLAGRIMKSLSPFDRTEADGIVTTLLVHHAQFPRSIETNNFL